MFSKPNVRFVNGAKRKTYVLVMSKPRPCCS